MLSPVLTSPKDEHQMPGNSNIKKKEDEKYCWRVWTTGFLTSPAKQTMAKRRNFSVTASRHHKCLVKLPDLGNKKILKYSVEEWGMSWRHSAKKQSWQGGEVGSNGERKGDAQSRNSQCVVPRPTASAHLALTRPTESETPSARPSSLQQALQGALVHAQVWEP